ncbi:hypothetical protein [Streptomyces sp. NPDC012888]|uniref:hypothetical protein n=1 Tax=Streptomyces sp. NPDC012888 TaxID=3364855 RepID=UPI0036B45FDE
MKTSPGGTCQTGTPPPAIGKTDLRFEARGSDPDDDAKLGRDLKHVRIKVWRADGHVVTDSTLTPDSTGLVWTDVPSASFTHGHRYYWSAWSIDQAGWWSAGGPAGTDAVCSFTVDHVAPPSPAVRSVHFPEPGPDGSEWSLHPAATPDQWIEVLGNGARAEDIAEFQWSLNRPTYDQKTWVWDAANALGSIKLKVDTAGPNVLYVRTRDKAENVSPATTYFFYVRPRPGQDKPGDVTGDGMPDILAVDGAGNLRTYAGDAAGDTDAWMPAALKDGKPVEDGYWTDGPDKAALITHSLDWMPGDGLTDLIARMPDGKLYVYPGDGTGRFDVGRRRPMLLPPGAPDPAGFRQIVAVEDVTGDRVPELFALAGDTLWALTGYRGASFGEARQVATGWAERDLIGVRDVSGDKVPDLLFRDSPSGDLLLRKGKAGADGGVDLGSFKSAVASLGGADTEYGDSGWSRAAVPRLHGTADATGDGIPDFWMVHDNGVQRLVPGGTTAHGWGGAGDEDGWHLFKAIG